MPSGVCSNIGAAGISSKMCDSVKGWLCFFVLGHSEEIMKNLIVSLLYIRDVALQFKTSFSIQC